MTEHRDIPGYPGYRVGDDGTVWTRRRKGCVPGVAGPWRPMKLFEQRSGHLFVSLSNGVKGEEKWKRVHRLVLLAFVGPCPDGLQGRHLDGNPKNNNLSNLRYGTRLENAADAIRHGATARGERNGCAKLTREQVLDLRDDADDGMTCDQLAAKYGVTRTTANLAARRINWGWLPERPRRCDAALVELAGGTTPALFPEPDGAA